MQTREGMVLTQVAPNKLRRQMFDALVDYILGSNLRPGHQLPSTAALCEQFNASRSVVREALSALEAVGLLEINSGKNAIVRELDGQLISLFLARALQHDAKPLQSLMEVRAPLEIQAAELAAARATTEERENLLAELHRMGACVEDTSLYPSLDVAFHLSIARASRNSALIWMTETLHSKLAESMERMRGYRDSHHLVGLEHQEHEAIATAIVAGRPEEAAAAMSCHMKSSLDLVRVIDSIDTPDG